MGIHKCLYATPIQTESGGTRLEERRPFVLRTIGPVRLSIRAVGQCSTSTSFYQVSFLCALQSFRDFQTTFPTPRLRLTTMDPLSGAASIIAVVSLVIQVCGSAREIRDFLGSISNAPKEIGRIQEQIELLHTLCDGIQSVVERQRIGGDNTNISTTALRALQQCSNKLALISAAVMGIGLQSNKKKNRLESPEVCFQEASICGV